MNVDIYIRGGGHEIRVPWLPEDIDFESGGVIKATYDIMGKGPVEVQTGTGLGQYQWESIFPGAKRTEKSMMRGEWKDPATYHNILEDWRKKGTTLTLIVVGYPIHKQVTIDDYVGSASGGFGDIVYKVKFVEDRAHSIQTSSGSTSTYKLGLKTVRPAEKVTSYTIKEGDTLWKIAESLLGDGSKWEKIYSKNKAIIETTAKEHGKRNSNNGWWIYPGVKLTIP